MQKTRLQALLAVGILCALFGASSYFAKTAPLSEAATIGQHVDSFSELSDRFAKLATEKGAVYAFDVLRIAKLPSSTDVHLLGHTIGNILYQQKGVAGMSDCTQEFRNACSHTIAIGTLSEYGEDGALPLIHDACLKAPGGSGAYTMCYHGLGHGVFAYFGYDLQKTVTFCKKAGTAEHGYQEYAQCIGGAIMELVGGGGHDHKLWLAAQPKYFTSDPLSPCTSTLIPAEAKTLCYSYLTPRLFTLAGVDIGSPDPALFAKAFSYCDALPASNSRLRDACYGGFGKEFIPMAGGRDTRAVDAFTDAQYAAAAGFCGTAGLEAGIESCIGSEVSSIFWGGENNPDASYRFCTLTGSAANACYSRLAGEIRQYVGGQRGAELCSRLPEAFVAQCNAKPKEGEYLPGILHATTP